MNKFTAAEILEIVKTGEREKEEKATNKRKEEGQGLTYCWEDIWYHVRFRQGSRYKILYCL